MCGWYLLIRTTSLAPTQLLLLLSTTINKKSLLLCDKILRSGRKSHLWSSQHPELPWPTWLHFPEAFGWSGTQGSLQTCASATHQHIHMTNMGLHHVLIPHLTKDTTAWTLSYIRRACQSNMNTEFRALGGLWSSSKHHPHM